MKLTTHITVPGGFPPCPPPVPSLGSRGGGGLVLEPTAHPQERKVAAGANYRPQTQACKLLVGASPVEPL